MTDDGVRCALEYDCVRRGRHDLPPQAGIGVYERPRRRRTSRGAQEQTHRTAADSARGGTLEFTAGSITGPAAEIVASAVNESPAGQVTVTSVVKDLALGSSLALAAASTSPQTQDPPPQRRATTAIPGPPARHARPHIGRSGPRRAQSDLICAPRSIIAEESPTDQNGGSVRLATGEG